MSEENVTYEAAYTELEAILRQLESDSLSIEQLAESVARATFLLNLCMDKMRAIEADIQQIAG